MKRIISVILALMMVMSAFAVSPFAVITEKEYFNADVEAYSDNWFYYVDNGKIYRETNEGENRTYYSSGAAEKICVSDGLIYILRESGINRYDVSKKTEKTIVSVGNIARFSLADGILYYLADGKVFAKNLSSGETKEFVKADDFWLESADKLSYMVDEEYIYTIDFVSGATEKNINNVSYFSDNLTVSSGVVAGSHSGIAPQAISIKKLRDKFPAGKYWNHGSGSNNPDGYTSSGCYHHTDCSYDGSCGCNSFGSAIQCMGYAYKCGYDVTGSMPKSSSDWDYSSSKSAVDNVKAGDIIRYKNDGHSVYVIKVSGDTVTITDCNSDYHCKIRWDATISKSTLKSSFSYIRIAPFDAGYYTLNLNTCGGSCSAESVEVMDDEEYGELPTPTREGYNFIGWYTAESGGTKITAESTVDLDKVKELYAHWELKTYTVTFNANGGEKAPDAQTKKHFTDLVLTSSEPERYGYTFVEWNTSADGSGTAYGKSDRYKIESNVTLFAQWKAKSVRLTFNFNGTTPSELGRNVIFGRKYSEEKALNGFRENKLPSPTREGYDFSGWYLDKNGGGLVTDESIVSVAEYHTVYAHWSEKRYIISYNGKGENGAWPQDQYKLYFSQATISNIVPTSTGMTFIEWNTSEIGNGTRYMPGETYSVNEPLYLFAQWDRERYDVTYDANGGYGAPSSQTKEYGLSLKLSSTEPKRTGYTFSGWSDGSGTTYQPSDTYTQNKPVNFEAKWKANKYTVKFDYLEGYYDVRQKEVTYDSTYGILPESSKAGYVFMGWYTEETGGDRINSTDKVKITGDITLYAHWELMTYDVTFVSDGINVPAAQKKNHGEDLKLTTYIPINEGYSFVEWNTSADGTGQGFASGGIYYKDAPATLYAIWKNAEYVVSYDANGGVNAPAPQTKVYGSAVVISDSVPEKEGFDFLGWNTAKDGNGAEYIGGAEYSENESVVLFAEWKAKQFTAKLNDGISITDYNLTYGKPYGNLPTPEKEGFTFIGWADSESRVIRSNEVFRGNSDVELNAVWLNNKELASGDTYYAAFVDNGKVVEKIPYTSGTESIQEPVLADIYGYVAEWEEYSLTDGGIVVFSIRTPVSFSAEFIADGKTVSTVDYTVEDKEISEPDIPEKEGYSAEWEKYQLGGNIEINAVYTAIEYEAKFVAKGKVISTVKYTVGAKSIAAPRIPDREGYSGKWEDYSVVAGGITVNAIYTMNKYTVHFFADGEEVATREFTVDSEKILEPDIPVKNGYSGRWEDYSFNVGDINVNAIYTPNDYYVTFRVDGNEIKKVKYTYGATEIEIPEIPEKAGYYAKWGSFELGYSDSTVNAIYIPIVYTATFVADGVIIGTQNFTVRTTVLVLPKAPEKDGYDVSWPEYTIGAGDMTIEAVYTFYKQINIRGFKYEKHLDYKSTVLFTAEPVGMTDECEIRWFLNGEYAGTGETFEVYRATENYTVQAKIIDKNNGEVLAESKTERIYIKDSLSQKFKAFFKMLFNALPVIEQ